MKKKTVKTKLSLDKKVITSLHDKQMLLLNGGISGANSLEWQTRCCCGMAQVIE
jgi:hypothetical protein